MGNSKLNQSFLKTEQPTANGVMVDAPKHKS